MQSLIHTFLSLLKWPLAACALALTPACAFAFWEICRQLVHLEVWKHPFGIGFSSALVFWMIFGRSRFVKFWSTMDHEFTHAIFAWITGVRVLELRSTDGSPEVLTDDSEGHVRIAGGNWLIALSPYFFPTAAAVIWIATWALAENPSVFARGMIGAATAYSILSTVREIHPLQSDFEKAGKLFTLAVLPCFNLVIYGVIVANEFGGEQQVIGYLKLVISKTAAWIGM